MIVYLITNTINGKRYVGQTARTLDARWWQHCNKTSARHYLHRAIQKYGKENFSKEIICEPPTRELTNEIESYYIARYNSMAPHGYNLTTGGDCPTLSAESRKKMSISRKGVRPPSSFAENWTEEDREKARQRMLGNKHLLGHSPSEETRKKISESMKRRRQIDFWSTNKAKNDRRQTCDALNAA